MKIEDNCIPDSPVSPSTVPYQRDTIFGGQVPRPCTANNRIGIGCSQQAKADGSLGIRAVGVPFPESSVPHLPLAP